MAGNEWNKENKQDHRDYDRTYLSDYEPTETYHDEEKQIEYYFDFEPMIHHYNE